LEEIERHKDTVVEFLRLEELDVVVSDFGQRDAIFGGLDE
jgi:hypothetical protein